MISLFFSPGNSSLLFFSTLSIFILRSFSTCARFSLAIPELTFFAVELVWRGSGTLLLELFGLDSNLGGAVTFDLGFFAFGLVALGFFAFGLYGGWFFFGLNSFFLVFGLDGTGFFGFFGAGTFLGTFLGFLASSFSFIYCLYPGLGSRDVLTAGVFGFSTYFFSPRSFSSFFGLEFLESSLFAL